MKPTLPEYLKAAEGRVWAEEDTRFVREHVAAIEKLAQDLAESLILRMTRGARAKVMRGEN